MPLHEIIGSKCNRNHWEQLAVHGMEGGGREEMLPDDDLEMCAWSFCVLRCAWQAAEGLEWSLSLAYLK